MRSPSHWIAALVILSSPLAFGLVGCDSGGPSVNLVPVRGTITMDGAPMGDADVSFSFEGTRPAENYYGSMGKTDPNGKYELKNMGRPGAAEGKYKVIISKITKADGSPLNIDPNSGMDAAQMVMSGDAIESIPRKYSSLESELTADVTAAKSDGYDFSLSSK